MSHPPILNYSPDRPPQLEQPCMRDGIYLVTQREVSLPQHCILCGAAATESITHTVPLRETSRLVSRAKMELWYCPRHIGLQRRGRMIVGIMALLTMLLMAVTLILASQTPTSVPRDRTTLVVIPWAILPLLAIALGEYWINRGKPAFHHIVGNHIYFAGVSEAFLCNLPGRAPALGQAGNSED